MAFFKQFPFVSFLLVERDEGRSRYTPRTKCPAGGVSASVRCWGWAVGFSRGGVCAQLILPHLILHMASRAPLSPLALQGIFLASQGLDPICPGEAPPGDCRDGDICPPPDANLPGSGGSVPRSPAHWLWLAGVSLPGVPLSTFSTPSWGSCPTFHPQNEPHVGPAHPSKEPLFPPPPSFLAPAASGILHPPSFSPIVTLAHISRFPLPPACHGGPHPPDCISLWRAQSLILYITPGDVSIFIAVLSPLTRFPPRAPPPATNTHRTRSGHSQDASKWSKEGAG